MTEQLKVKELEVGKRYDLLIALLEAVPKTTKAGKPYLYCTFTDGEDQITGNYWDWNGVNRPNSSLVVVVACEVSEWQGQKQLTVRGMNTYKGEDVNILDFMEQPHYMSVDNAMIKYCNLVNKIQDEVLQTICFAAIREPNLQQKWLSAPAAKSFHHAYRAGVLVHSVEVAQIAGRIATVTRGANADLCIAGGLLHDIGKLWGYHFNGIKPDMTYEGMLQEHVFLGASFIKGFVDNFLDMDSPIVTAKVNMLVHIILSHHMKQEYGSPVTPMSMEAMIVSHADDISAKAEAIRDASRSSETTNGASCMTDKVWIMENRQMLTTQYVGYVMDAPVQATDIQVDNLSWYLEKEEETKQPTDWSETLAPLKAAADQAFQEADGCATCNLPDPAPTEGSEQ